MFLLRLNRIHHSSDPICKIAKSVNMYCSAFFAYLVVFESFVGILIGDCVKQKHFHVRDIGDKL